MTSINTSYNDTVPQQITTQAPTLKLEQSKSYNDAVGQFIAASLDKQKRPPAIPPEMEKNLEAWRAFLDQFVLDKDGNTKNENGDYIDDEGNFKDKNGNLIDVGKWISDWIDRKRILSLSI